MMSSAIRALSNHRSAIFVAVCIAFLYRRKSMLPESFWQEILPPDASACGGYAARFDDGRVLLLPIRPLPDGKRALASLIINQASFTVLQALATCLARKLAAFDPEVVVGLPTLGLTLASAVAQQLGHTRYVPLGNSAKFWYRAELSVPLSSVTTPDQEKRLFIDPRMLPLLERRRIALVDDVISSGVSMLAGIALLAACGVQPVVLGTAMLQSEGWQRPLAGWDIVSVLRSPILSLE
jgi:adenine/guanine phosphoribosyltransferase-like PRPP-binding protein